MVTENPTSGAPRSRQILTGKRLESEPLLGHSGGLGFTRSPFFFNGTTAL
jgi:hypothetical protein